MPSLDRIAIHRVLLRQSDASQNRAQAAARCRARLAEAVHNLTAPSAMPPQAILVIRRLADPSPGHLLSQPSTHAWSRGAEAQIAATWQRAIRAAHAAVPPNADAVWFADPAEWLACLSWELYEGSAAHHWWWQSWLSQASLSSALPNALRLFRLWQRHAQVLPQALAYLFARRGDALDGLLRQLSPDQTGAITTLVEAAYSLPVLPAHSPSFAPPIAATRMAARLPAPQATLLALCLGLVHTPLVVQRHYQRPTFVPLPAPPPSDPPPPPPGDAAPQRRFSRPHRHSAGGGESRDNLAQSPNEPERGKRRYRQGEPLRLLHRRGSPQGRPFTPAEMHHSSAAEPAEPKVPAKSPSFGVESHLPALRSPKPTPPYSGEGTTSPRRKLIFLPQSRQKRMVQDVENAALPHPGQASSPLATNLGGVWLLVNVLVVLEWLEGDAEEAYALNGWHKLAALAHTLTLEGATPTAAQTIEADPLWALLDAQSAEVAPTGTRSAWLAYALPRVHAYLAARMEEPAAFFAALHDPALVHLTSAHVDVIFELAQIRLDLRLAGLDQNPGWVPALGRVVTLHYV